MIEKRKKEQKGIQFGIKKGRQKRKDGKAMLMASQRCWKIYTEKSLPLKAANSVENKY